LNTLSLNHALPISIKQLDKFVWRKAEPSIEQTLDGITIDSMDEHKNTPDSIRVNREFDSNEIDESDPQYQKHDEPRISTPRGIEIDRSDEYENA
jgi:hypothetical protein